MEILKIKKYKFIGFVLLGMIFRSSLWGLCDVGVVFDFSGSSTGTLTYFCDLLSGDNFCVSAGFSWRQMEGFMQDADTVGKLKRLAGLGKIEILAGVYYDQDLLRTPMDVLYGQIKRFKLLSENVFGFPVTGFQPPNLILKTTDFQMLKNLGFEYSLIAENEIPGEDENERIQPHLTGNGVIIYPVSRRLSAAATQPAVENWLEDFRGALGSLSGGISDSIPGGSLVFSVDMKNYSDEKLKMLFDALKTMNIKTKTLKHLFSKQPAFFRELNEVRPPDDSSKSFFQSLFLAEWKHFCSVSDSFPPSIRDEVLKLGNFRYFESIPTPEQISEIIRGTGHIYEKKPDFTFESPYGKIFSLSNGVFRIYFSERDLTPLLIISEKQNKIFAGVPFSGGQPAALRNYFNYRSFGEVWSIKKEVGEETFRITAELKAAPFEIKKTFVIGKGRDFLKIFCSVSNQGDKGNSCDVSFDVAPVDLDSVYLSCADGEFFGVAQNVSKEFTDIKKIVFPAEKTSLFLEFFGKYPFFMTFKKPHFEIVYPGRELSPDERLLFEIHLGFRQFELPENTHPLFGYSEILLDGFPNEQFWRDASSVIDPMRDGQKGCDIGGIYFLSKNEQSFFFVEGDLESTDNIYIAKTGEGSKVLKDNVSVPDAADYFIRVPVKTGYPASYRWDNLWFATFEKGFSFVTGKNSLEMRLPWAFRKGQWAVYIEKNGEICDSAYFTVQ